MAPNPGPPPNFALLQVELATCHNNSIKKGILS